MSIQPQTQAQIDAAVLLGKSAVANLAYELAIEIKNGGRADCCLCNLGVLWGWTNALLCQQEVTDDFPEADNCLTDKEAKELIGKINSTCKQ